MSAPIDEGQRALQFMLEKSASRTDLLKKALLIVAGIFGVGFAVWYFVLRGSEPAPPPPPTGGLPGETTGTGEYGRATKVLAPAIVRQYPLADEPYAILGGVLPTDTVAEAAAKIVQAKLIEQTQIARARAGGYGGL